MKTQNQVDNDINSKKKLKHPRQTQHDRETLKAKKSEENSKQQKKEHNRDNKDTKGMLNQQSNSGNQHIWVIRSSFINLGSFYKSYSLFPVERKV